MHFKVPFGITYWQNKLYVVDAGNNRVHVFKLKNQPFTKAFSPKKIQSSRKNCLTCHLSWSENYNNQTQILPVVQPSMCYSCHHGAVIDLRSTIGHGQQHPSFDWQKAERKSKDSIPDKFPLVKMKPKLYCGSCHTPHSTHEDVLGVAAENTWMRITNLET